MAQRCTAPATTVLLYMYLKVIHIHMNKGPTGHECLRIWDDHESFANACLFIISGRIQNTPYKAKEKSTEFDTNDSDQGDFERDVLYQQNQ